MAVRPAGDERFPVWSGETLIGRADDIDRLVGVIGDGARLVTVTGPGGVGKTRLAVHVARQIAASESHRVVLVPLLDLRQVDEVVRALAAALDIRLISPDRPFGDLPEEILAELGAAPTLLVLDNAEHLRDLPDLIGQVLGSSPDLQIMVTSQRRLALGIETEYRVAPLRVPERSLKDQPDRPAAALALFALHAQRVWPEFALTPQTVPLVADVCRQVDGVPLAIELAAARLRILSLVQLRDRLAAGLPALGGGPRDLPARQQTIRGAIAWGYDLLSPTEQLLFRRLAVFTDGFDLVAAKQICADRDGDATSEAIDPDRIVDLLGGLEDASLLTTRFRPGGERRFRMLGIIRRFALEQLEASGERPEYQRRHTSWFAARVEAAEAAMRGSARASWLDWLDANAGNVRAAEETAFRDGPAADGLAEARRAMERALPSLATVPPAARATLQTSLGHVVSDLGEYAQAERLYTDALASRRAGEDLGQVAGLLNILGILLQTRGEYELARALHQESLAIRAARNESRGIALSMLNLGRVAYHLGDYDRAAAQEAEAIAILDDLGDQDQIAYACHAIGLTMTRQGQLATAREVLARSEGLFVELGDRFGVAYARQALGQIALLEGDLPAAADLMGRAIDLRREIGYVWGVVDSTEGTGELAARAGRPEMGLRLLLAAGRFRDSLGAPLNAADERRHRATVSRLRRGLGRARSAETATLAATLSRDRAADLALTLTVELAAADPVDAVPRTSTSMSTAAMTGDAVAYGLTPREHEVLGLVAEGKSDREIADRLFLSRRTVSEHVRHILGKLETPTRTAATALALRSGLI